LRSINTVVEDSVRTKVPVALISSLCRDTAGAFRGRDAVASGVNRKQLARLASTGVIVRTLPDTYCLTAFRTSAEQRLHAALLWAGDEAAAAARSAGALYGIEGVAVPPQPEIVLWNASYRRVPGVTVHRCRSRAALMVRKHRGMRVTGVEATLVALADVLPDETLETACEDARRRRLTTIPALHAYLDRFGVSGRNGVGKLSRLLHELDPEHPSRSTLEVKTRRLLVANGYRDFVREFALEWNGARYLFDFVFPRESVVLETNGRRWHDDANDYERDHEKWSVPGRRGYRIVFATWAKVTQHADKLLSELDAALSGSGGTSSRGCGG
jgi:very-short-patch-repair endonuclease